MPFTGPLEDRTLIRELYDSYADAACRGAKADWVACFTADANWWTHYFDVTGHEAISAQYDQLMAAVTTTIFMTQLCSVEVAGNTARGRAVCSECLMMGAHGEMRLTGTYHDDLVRTAEGWRFARRVYKVMDEVMEAKAAPPAA
ncbi:MAG: nuclear transport factor 2 family protein [Sphingomonadales bacterium]|nr:nuclear transport factor 2 family protein [Sphingomonadales bacterium]